MEIDKEVFKKYAEIKVDDIEKIENLDFSFIDNLYKEMQHDLDDMYYKFLTENGYKLDKPYKVEQIEAIKEDLAKQDKFVDYLEYTEFENNFTQAYHYILPFFNSISNPLTDEEKTEMLNRWKEINGKEK